MKETTMNLTKEEQQFIAENITRYDVVTNLTVDNIEIRIHGKTHGGSGSTALYRTANIEDIYAHGEEKYKEACGAIADCASRPWPADGVWNEYLESEADKLLDGNDLMKKYNGKSGLPIDEAEQDYIEELFDSKGWMKNTKAGRE